MKMKIWLYAPCVIALTSACFEEDITHNIDLKQKNEMAKSSEQEVNTSDRDLELKKIREVLVTGCDLGRYIFCYNLAGMMEKGQGGKKDIEGSQVILNDLCDKDYERACRKLAGLPVDNSKISKTPPTVIAPPAPVGN